MRSVTVGVRYFVIVIVVAVVGHIVLDVIVTVVTFVVIVVVNFAYHCIVVIIGVACRGSYPGCDRSERCSACSPIC